MFNYTNEQGFDYACKLLSDYLASDYFENPNGVKELCLTEEELKNLFKTRSFKEFLIQREKDYIFLANHLSEISYDYEEGFGNILDLNPGKYEVVSAFDSFYNSEALVVTRYSDPLFFNGETRVVQGSVDLMGILEKEKTTYFPILRTENFVKGKAYTSEKLELSSFDTLIYLHDTELNRMLTLLRYALETDKKLICGIVTNVFDKNVEEKFSGMQDVINELNKKNSLTFETEEIVSKGSAIKLIHTLK